MTRKVSREDWRTWVIMGGRGAGKTRAGAEWVRSKVEGPRPLDMLTKKQVKKLNHVYKR